MKNTLRNNLVRRLARSPFDCLQVDKHRPAHILSIFRFCRLRTRLGACLFWNKQVPASHFYRCGFGTVRTAYLRNGKPKYQ